MAVIRTYTKGKDDFAKGGSDSVVTFEVMEEVNPSDLLIFYYPPNVVGIYQVSKVTSRFSKPDLKSTSGLMNNLAPNGPNDYLKKMSLIDESMSKEVFKVIKNLIS